MSRGARGAVGAAVTLLLLWWVLRDVSPAAVFAEMRDASPWWLFVAVALATFSFVLRAFRWRVLLEPGHEGSSFEARFGATCAGFAANNIFPARLGELVRAYVLSRVVGLPLGVSIGSLVVERVLDGLVLASFLVVAILLPGFPIGEGDGAGFVRRAAMIGSVVFAAGFVVLWFAARRPTSTLRLWDRTAGRVLSGGFGHRVRGLLHTFLEGLGALARLDVLARAIGWSLVVWTCLAASFLAGMWAFDIREPGFAGALFLQSVVGFAVAVPSTPGFFGVFEAGARLGLQPWGISEDTIVSFATTYHILTFIPVTVLGLLYVRHVGLRWSDVRNRSQDEAADVESQAARTP